MPEHNFYYFYLKWDNNLHVQDYGEDTSASQIYSALNFHVAENCLTNELLESFYQKRPSQKKIVDGVWKRTLVAFVFFMYPQRETVEKNVSP